MSKPSNREKILTEGLRLVHERGFVGASVRDIAQAANVPLGSFTNHFPSKKVFGLEVMDRYHEQNQQVAVQTLHDTTRPVRDRFNAYFDRVITDLCGNGMRGGCLLGNFYAEVAGQSEMLRLRLAEIIQDIHADMRVVLEEGVASGELRADLDCGKAAAFIYASLQGAILISKVLRAPTPIEICRSQIMENMFDFPAHPERRAAPAGIWDKDRATSIIAFAG